jgi:uncharacterized protein YcgI (DUF1989 family)
MTFGKFPVPPFDRRFYESLRAARVEYRLEDQFIITVDEGGKAFVVPRGHSVRFTCLEAAQVADVCLWNANGTSERFWNDQTFNREGPYLSVFTRLWTNMPWFRPLMTVLEDTVETKHNYPGSGHHMIWGAHCNPHYWYWALQDEVHPFVTRYNCYYNLIRALAPFGLGAGDLHDNVCLFQKSHFDVVTRREVGEPSDARKGDYIELYAEMDVLVAVSLCPNGSDSLTVTSGEWDVTPLGIDIYYTGIEPLEFTGPQIAVI